MKQGKVLFIWFVDDEEDERGNVEKLKCVNTAQGGNEGKTFNKHKFVYFETLNRRKN